MKKFFYLFFIIPFLISCVESVVAPVNTSFPLGQINYNDSILFEKAGLGDIVRPNKDNVLSITSSEDVDIISSEKLDSLFKFPPQNLEYSEPTGIDFPPDANPSDLFELENPIIFEVILEGLEDDERLDIILFYEATIRVNVTNAPAGSNLNEVRWEILELLTGDFPNSGFPEKRTVETTHNIANSWLVPNNKEGKPYLTVRITGKIPPMDTIKGNVIIECKKYHFVRGFAGRKVVEIEPTTIDFSAQLQDFSAQVEEVYFENPMLVFEIRNTNLYLPLLIRIVEVEIDGVPLQLSNDIAKTQFLIEPPLNYVTPTKQFFEFNNSNTVGNDLSNKLNINTQTVTFKTVAISNPTVAKDGIDGGSDTNAIYNNFIGGFSPSLNINSEVDGIYNAELPLIGYVRGLQFEQIYSDVSFEIEDANWQGLTLAFIGENSILLDFDVDLFTVGDNEERIKLNETPLRIPAAFSEEIPYIISQNNMPSVVLNKEKVDAIDKHKKLILQFYGSTKNIDSKEIIRLLSPTNIKLNLIVGTELEIKN